MIYIMTQLKNHFMSFFFMAIAFLFLCFYNWTGVILSLVLAAQSMLLSLCINKVRPYEEISILDKIYFSHFKKRVRGRIEARRFKYDLISEILEIDNPKNVDRREALIVCRRLFTLYLLKHSINTRPNLCEDDDKILSMFDEMEKYFIKNNTPEQKQEQELTISDDEDRCIRNKT